MKGLIIVFTPDCKHCMISDGTVEVEDMRGFQGTFIRKTIYRAREVKLFQRFALWLLGFDLDKLMDN